MKKKTSSMPVIIETITSVLRDDGKKAPRMKPATKVLSETGLDSLSLAEVVVRLQDRLKKDPFRSGFKNFTTIQELADLYDK